LIRTLGAADTNRNVPRQWLALVYAEVGDEANTAKWLNRSADAHEWQVLNAAVHPFYKNMQNSPEFRTLKRALGSNFKWLRRLSFGAARRKNA
jgi:hypothetical protein